MTSRESRNAADERRRYRGEERDDERRRHQSRQYKTSVDRENRAARLGGMKTRAEAAAAERVPPEPLRLPRGSVRAMVTLLVASACLVVFLRRQPVPGSLLELALATVAYYFALRRTSGAKPLAVPYAEGGSAQYSRTSSTGAAPLYMPSGVIRWLLIVGFAVGAGALVMQGRMADVELLGFYTIMAGLVGGYLFARAASGVGRSAGAMVLFNDLKALGVLVAALALGGTTMLGAAPEYPYVVMGLSAVVSFYFGSRS